MANEEEDFDKKFTEIVSSNNLSEINESYSGQVKMGLKELAIMQQSILEALGHINELILNAIEGANILDDPLGEELELLTALYKISEDFNECISDKYLELAIIDEDDEEENEEELNGDENEPGPEDWY